MSRLQVLEIQSGSKRLGSRNIMVIAKGAMNAVLDNLPKDSPLGEMIFREST
jgi:hypothetical protein